MIEDNHKTAYWKRIRENIKLLYNGELSKERGKISKRYTLKGFCERFISDEEPFDEKENKCICGHDIYQNYKYYHKNKGEEEFFVLGSCCIKRFSREYYLRRTCKDCNTKIKYCKSQRCKECKNKYKTCKKCNEVYTKEKTLFEMLQEF